MRLAMVVAFVGACSSHDTPPADPPPPVPQLAGNVWQRLTQLDVDVALPAGASIDYRTALADVRWPGCQLQISVAGHAESELVPRVIRHVGTLALECVAGPRGFDTDPKCLAVCDHMRPSTGGTATDVYPTELPAIELETHGGWGGTRRGARAWRDGTVQFFGSMCPAWRGRRVMVPAQVIADAVKALDKRGIFTLDVHHRLGCTEDVRVDLTVRDGERDHAIHFYECSYRELGLVVQELQTTLGPNPCNSTL